MARPKSDIQERILLAAHQRFLAEGVEAASLRNIAKDAETSIGMVYYYYTTKDELFLAVIEDTYQQLLSELEVILRAKSCYCEQMRCWFERIARLSTHELEVMRLVVRESLTSCERRKRLLSRFLRGHVPLLLRAVLDGVKSGELDASMHPLVILSCTLGIGTVPTLMLRAAKESWAGLLEHEQMPDLVKTAMGELIAQLPHQDFMAQTLMTLIRRSVGAKA